MFSRSLVFVVVAMMLMLLGTGVEAAPTERGFVRLPPHLPSLNHASVIPEKSSPPNPSQYLKHWRLSTKANKVDRAAAGTFAAGLRARRLRANPEPSSADRRAQMLKMITALEELQRTFNSTLSSRITIMPRAGGRNPGRKHKTLPAADGSVKPTTVAPAAVNSTASRASADDAVPSMAGRNLKKSLLSQNKKTNKRVCFWKYCSQN